MEKRHLRKRKLTSQGHTEKHCRDGTMDTLATWASDLHLHQFPGSRQLRPAAHKVLELVDMTSCCHSPSLFVFADCTFKNFFTVNLGAGRRGSGVGREKRQRYVTNLLTVVTIGPLDSLGTWRGQMWSPRKSFPSLGDTADPLEKGTELPLQKLTSPGKERTESLVMLPPGLLGTGPGGTG